MSGVLDKNANRGILSLLQPTALDALFWVVGIGLVGANVILLQQNRKLKTVANNTEDKSANIQPGKHLSRFLAAATPAGGFRSIPFPAPDSQQTLLVTFSPGCPHCRANRKNWDLIAKELRRRGGWRIFWVSRDPVEMTKDYCEDFTIPLEETFADPTYRTWMSLNLNEVPNTIVVDGNGVLNRVWRGELDSTSWSEVFRYFKISLPASFSP